MFRLLSRQPVQAPWLFAERTARRGRPGVLRSIAAALYAGFAAAAAQSRLRRAERQLEALDDRLLQDIGVGRSEIRRLVRHGRRRSQTHR